MSKDVKFNIRLSVDGKDQVVTATASVKDMAKSIANVQAAVEKNASAFNKWKDSAMAVSGTITAIQSMRGALSDLTAESNQFTAAMKEANTMAGKDGAGFQQLKKQVSELSESIPIARDALAKGLYQVISNGVPEDNWMSYLEKSAKASVGGLADLQEVVKVTSTVIKNYGLSWEDAEKVQDKIQLTAKNGVTSFEQLAQALPKVASNAASLGITMDELMGAFATLTGVSGNTQEVATQIGAVMTALIKPSKEAQKMADEMGIKFDAAAIKSAGGLREFLTQLDTAVKKYAESSGVLEKEVYGRLFGSAEALRALSPLTGQLAAKFGENVDAMADSAGTMDQAYETMNSGAAAATQKIMNMIGGWMDSLAALNGNYMAILNVASSMGVLVMSLFTVGKGLWAAIAAARTFCTQIGLTTAVQKVAAACSVRFGAMLKVLSANMKGVAVSARTMKLAIEGALITTGVGAALVVLSELVSGLASATDDAADGMEELAGGVDEVQQAQETFSQAAGEAQAAIDKDVTELKKLIDAHADTTAAVHTLNEKYGDIFGTYKTAAEWYDTLISKSKEYCMQLGYEAMLKQLYTQKAGHETKAELLKQQQRELIQHGGGYDIRYEIEQEGGNATGITLAGGSYTPYAADRGGKIVQKRYATNALLKLQNAEAAERRQAAALDKEIATGEKLRDESLQKLKEQNVNVKGGGGNTPSTTPTRSHSSNAPQQQQEQQEQEDKRTTEQKLQDQMRAAQNKYVELHLTQPQSIEEQMQLQAQMIKQLSIIDEAKKGLAQIARIRDDLANPSKLQSIEDYNARLSYIDNRLQTAQTDAERTALLKERKEVEDALDKMKELPKVAPVLGQQKTLADYDSAIQFYTDEQRNADVNNITELQKTIDTLNKQKDAMMLGTRLPGMQQELADLGTRGTKEYTLKLQEVGIDTVKDKIKELNTLLEDTTLNLPDAWRDALAQLLEQWKAASDDLTGVEKENKKLEGLKSAASSVDQLAQSFSKLSSESKGLAVAMQSVSLAATFTQIIATMVSKSKSSITVWDWIAGITAGTAAAISSITALKGVAFAEGGIVHGPTLGLVGEYPGASSNPEVIAPLNKLRSLIGEGSGYGEVRFEIAGDRLEGVLKRRQKLHNRR